jgi:glutamine---fructose-6-phosphate transaminase (isomerizing)
MRWPPTDGTWFLAPVERLASALQGALMVREGPRRRADACETGDWSHVDVYLTKTLDYRSVVFAGSRHEAAAAEWMSARRSTSVAVGGSFPEARIEVRYPGDDQPLVALLTEVLVAELVAAAWWAPSSGTARA